MAISRGLPTVAMSVVNTDAHFARSPTVSRSNSQSSTDSLVSQPRGMPIHGRRPLNVPPPLRPPQYIEELHRGQDIGYRIAHNEDRNNNELPTIPEGSSLSRGTYSRPRPVRPYKPSMEIGEGTGRRLSSSNLEQPSHAEGGSGAHSAKMARRSNSPSNSSTLLQGEFPLAQESHDRSNRDYDTAMLSKIGKTNSPPRPLLAQTLSLQTKDVNGQRPSANEPSSAVDSVTPSITSPISTGVSPAARYEWQHQNGPRSPPRESGLNPPFLDPELFVQRPTHQHPINGTTAGHECATNRSTRNSYDQGIYTRAESEHTEDSARHSFNMDDSQSALRKTPGTSMKRKALSPPGDRHTEDRPRQELYALRMRVAPKSPGASYVSNNGSVSSAASSIQPQSYASSGPFSASSVPLSNAASSMTSISSSAFDPNSPRDQPPYLTSAGPVDSPISNMISRKGQEKLVPRKLSAQTTTHSTRPLPTRIGNNYICACCPKKPKKFETEEQLHAHENEKQYSCNFCHNRFKNKNEAERHQNSLHLRRHSWSCAALADFHAAFSPSGAVDSSSTATDACGYCGEEFPNHPTPDWDRRLEHLTNVHKFGECNSAKKFFRADHFRQHLKHSHGGRSGKWTNILEHACVRDEIPPESAGFSPSSVDHNLVAQGRGSTGLSGPTDVSASMNMVHES